MDAASSARECLKQAMRLSIDIEDQARAADHRRDLIDIADQIDPAFADELIELVDDDPARAQLKSEALHASALAKAKREMANAKSPKGAARFDRGRLGRKSPDHYLMPWVLGGGARARIGNRRASGAVAKDPCNLLRDFG